MDNHTFLGRLSTEIIAKYKNDLYNITIVLPNKRAKVFLLEELKQQLPTAVFAPVIISIEDFIQDIAQIRALDNIELLFEFYKVYLCIPVKDKHQDFETFANWAKTLLQDFNEIDRYLLNPSHVLTYLKNIEDIKHWSLDLEKRTAMIQNYLEFWELLPVYYNALYSHLISNNTGYQGLIYREAVKNSIKYSEVLPNAKRFIFAGFNALNAAEEKIIQHFLLIKKADIYWDIDEVFLNDVYHDAGLFIRKFKKSWKQFNTDDFKWITNDFSTPKNINIIGTPKSVGQAKIAGNILEDINKKGHSFEKTAIVLGEENLLIPVLYGLPQSVDSLNITMGYNSKNNPAQIIIQKIFKLHINAAKRNEHSYTFYYKEALDILTHPLVEPYINSSYLVSVIKQNNITFLSINKFFEIAGHPSDFFRLIFERWENDTAKILERLGQIMLSVKSFLKNDNEQDKITKAFLYSIHKVINKLINFNQSYSYIQTPEILYNIYKQIIDLAEVSFEGEPLSGLQIMGVLESRVLDFETVIITSVNEGKFPAGKTQNSFIPYDVKKELGLPTYKEKDAIYSYHFYHLLLRTKNVYLLYNTESEGLDAGEKSRFLTQLEIERNPNHNLTHKIYNAYLPEKAYEIMTVPKSEKVMQRLLEIATGKGFSPSALTSYIRNPIQFYYQKVLRIRETDEVEENIALNTLGTIIHGTLEQLYTSYINKILTIEDVDRMAALADAEVMHQFIKVYKEGEIKKGKNLLAFEVAKRNVHNFLKLEKNQLLEGDIVKILALETHFSRLVQDNRLIYPVIIAGNIDRIEQRNGKIRIIDYKTGKVEKNNIQLKQWDNLCSDIKNEKIIQLLAYAFMYEPYAAGMDIEAGIISFKNMKSGFLHFGFKEEAGRNADIQTIITPGLLEAFKTELIKLINEILDSSIPFEEKL